jgi:hypothetical protein
MPSVKTIGKLILKSALKELTTLNYIKSITLVGGGLNKIQGGKDLDLLIIIDNLSVFKYYSIERILKKIAKKFSSNALKVRLEERIGPVKHLKKNEITIHQILYDISGYRKYCTKSPLVAYDWQRFSPLYGLPIKYFNEIKKLTFKQLITKRLGIKHYISMLNRGEIDCIVYKKRKNRMVQSILQVKLSKAQKINLSEHALRHTLTSAFKILSGKNEDNDLVTSLVKKACSR